MIRRTSKIALEIVGVAVAAIAVLLAVLGWRLSSGPISLPILGQILETTVNRQLPGGQLDIGNTILRWSQQDGDLGLRLVDVELKGADGNHVASIPEMSFRLSIAALLIGEIAPTQIDFYGVSATIVRRTGSGISLGLTPAKGAAPVPVPDAKTSSPTLFDSMLKTLKTGSSDSALFSRLSHIGVHNGALTYIDEVNGYSIEAPSANFAVFRDDRGVAGTLTADLKLGDTKGSLELDGELPRDSDIADVHLVSKNIVPAALARMSPAMASYALFDAPIDTDGRLAINTNGDLKSAQLKLVAGKGKFVLPGLNQVPVKLEKGRADLSLDAAAKRLTLKELVLQAGPHSIAMHGHADYTFGTGLNLATARVELDAGKTTTEIPGFFGGPIDISKAHFAGRLDFDKRTMVVETLTLGLKDGLFALGGKIEDGPRSPSLDIKGSISAVSIQTLHAIWPQPLATDAREWVIENTKEGRLENIKFAVKVPAGILADADEGKVIPNEMINLSFDIKSGTMIFLDGMPPLTGVTGHGLLLGNRFDAFVDSAVITLESGRIVSLSKGRFTDPTLATERTIGEIEFTAAGMTADILALLNHEPLKLIDGFGPDPSTVSGSGTVTTLLKLPLVKEVLMDDVEFSGKAHVDNIAIPHVDDDISITSGTLDIDVAKTGLTGKGPVSVNGANPLQLEWSESFVSTQKPGTSYRLTGSIDEASREALGLHFKNYISGPIDIDAKLTGNHGDVENAVVHADLTPSESRFDMLGWKKPAGKSVVIDFKMDFAKDSFRFSDFKMAGKDVDVRGKFTMDKEWNFAEMDLPTLKLGPDNDLVALGKRDTAGQLILDVKGSKADASGILQSVLSGSGDKEEAEKAATRVLTEDMAKDSRLRTRITVNVADVAGQNQTRFKNVKADVTLIDDWAYMMDVKGADQNGAAFAASTVPAENRTRIFKMRSDDAGFIFRTLDLFNDVQGGTLEADATYDDKQPGLPMKGVVTARKFRIVKASVLTKILTLGSLTGISDTLQGDGIFFEKLKLPFNITGHRIHIDDAYASGPAIGLTLNGEIDRVSNVNALEGTIVPAYTINSFFGKIPVLGSLIVGREGEGIFGFTYGVKGTTSDPSVYVNPLAALAPGFLRRLFEFSDTVPEQKPEGGKKGNTETVAPAEAKPVPVPEPKPTPPKVEQPEAAPPAPDIKPAPTSPAQ